MLKKKKILDPQFSILKFRPFVGANSFFFPVTFLLFFPLQLNFFFSKQPSPCDFSVFNIYILMLVQYLMVPSSPQDRKECGSPGITSTSYTVPQYMLIEKIQFTSISSKLLQYILFIYLSICGVGVLPSKRPGFYNE